MANNKISGRYILQCANKICDYEFTGNNRLANKTNDDVTSTNWVCLSNGSTNLDPINFFTKNKIHLKAIRITTPGGTGLRSLVGRCALITLYVKDTSQEQAFKVIEIAKYNEWQECDEYLEPYKFTNDQKFDLKIGYAKFNIDDFNIQSKYIGEKVYFYVELEIETAGLELNGNVI